MIDWVLYDKGLDWLQLVAKTTLVATLALLACLLLRNRIAAQRHGMLVAGVLGLWLILVFYYCTTPIEVAVIPATSDAVHGGTTTDLLTPSPTVGAETERGSRNSAGPSHPAVVAQGSQHRVNESENRRQLVPRRTVCRCPTNSILGRH